MFVTKGGAEGNYFDNEECRTCDTEWYDGWLVVVALGMNTLMGGFFKSHAFLRLLVRFQSICDGF